LGENTVELTSLWLIAEAMLRIILGWRFLISGLSNIRRWPNPVRTASILFPKGTLFFGFVATVFMVVGGLGMAMGFQTPVCSLMLIIFLIPTFSLHFHWLKVLPTMASVVKTAIGDEKARNYFQTFDRQSFHAHEVGLRDNLVFLAAAVYFAVRGSGVFGLDSLMSGWVVRLF
ncbi:MAG TPA: DoxX family protein, partial [Candidatus Binatia bacterium]|nr:DoxX family protein [Candidatus Binatia bacterium]